MDWPVDMNIFAERYPMLPIEYEKHLDKIGQNGTIVCSHQVRKMSSKGTFIRYVKQSQEKELFWSLRQFFIKNSSTKGQLISKCLFCVFTVAEYS